MRIVAVDTNILRASGLWPGPEIDLLVSYLRDVEGHLLIADTVWREFEKYAQETLSEQKQELVSRLRDPNWQRITGFPRDTLGPDFNDQLFAHWRGTWSAKLGTVLGYQVHDSALLEETWERALTKKRPFWEGKKGDSGFKDTVIWLGYLRFVSRTDGKRFAFISSDFAFAEPGEPNTLHHDLVTDSRSLDVAVEFFPSLAAFLDRHVKSASGVVPWLRDRVRHEDFARVVQAYYEERGGRFAPFEPLDEMLPHQAPLGAPVFLEFGVELEKAYTIDAGPPMRLLIMVGVRGLAELSTYDYRMRGNRFGPGEEPEPSGHHRFAPVGPLPVEIELDDESFRVLRVGDWQPATAIYPRYIATASPPKGPS